MSAGLERRAVSPERVVLMTHVAIVPRRRRRECWIGRLVDLVERDSIKSDVKRRLFRLNLDQNQLEV